MFEQISANKNVDAGIIDLLHTELCAAVKSQ